MTSSVGAAWQALSRVIIKESRALTDCCDDQEQQPPSHFYVVIDSSEYSAIIEVILEQVRATKHHKVQYKQILEKLIDEESSFINNYRLTREDVSGSCKLNLVFTIIDIQSEVVDDDDDTSCPKYEDVLKEMEYDTNHHFKPMIMPKLTSKLENLFHNRNKDDTRILSALKTLVHVNQRFSVSAIKNDPQGVVTVFNNVRGSPVMFLVSKEDTPDVLKQQQTKDTEVFLLPASGQDYYVVKLEQQGSIFMQPGKFYFWISLGSNIMIEQQIKNDNGQDGWKERINLQSSELADVEIIEDDINLFCPTADQQQANGHVTIFSQQLPQQLINVVNNDKVGPNLNWSLEWLKVEDWKGDPLDQSLLKVSVPLEKEPLSVTGVKKRMPQNATIVDLVGKLTRFDLHKIWEDEKNYRVKHGQWSIELDEWEKKDILQNPEHFGYIKVLKGKGAIKNIVSIYELPRHIEKDVLDGNFSTLKRKDGKNYKHYDMAAAHYKQIRLCNGVAVDAGGTCAMKLSDGRDCKFFSGRQPDLNRHVRQVHLTSNSTFKENRSLSPKSKKRRKEIKCVESDIEEDSPEWY